MGYLLVVQRASSEEPRKNVAVPLPWHASFLFLTSTIVGLFLAEIFISPEVSEFPLVFCFALLFFISQMFLFFVVAKNM